MYGTAIRLHEALKYFSIVNLSNNMCYHFHFIVDLNLFLISLFCTINFSDICIIFTVILFCFMRYRVVRKSIRNKYGIHV